MAAPILGVTTALEEQRANGAEIDDGAINGIKVGLMGPLAGVGDPIFWERYVRYLQRWGWYRDERQPVRSAAVLHPV